MPCSLGLPAGIPEGECCPWNAALEKRALVSVWYKNNRERICYIPVSSTLCACMVQGSDITTPLKTGFVWFDLTCLEGGFFSTFLKDGELLWSCNQINSPLSFQTLTLEIHVSSLVLPDRIQTELCLCMTTSVLLEVIECSIKIPNLIHLLSWERQCLASL